MKVVIVGGVAGGASAAARIRRLDEQAQITIFERTAHISYANCGLPYYIGGTITDPAALTLQTPESFTGRFNVEVRVSCEVTAIQPEAHTVTVKDLASGRKFQEPYDKLLLAPGAKPLQPRLPGLELERLFTLRTVEDAHRIRDFVIEKQPRSAVIAGGGFIGLEMAENLRSLGLAVTIVQQTPQLLPTFDGDMAAFIHSELRQHGVRLLLGQTVAGFAPKDEGIEVLLENNSPLRADMALLAIGVEPDTKLAREAGLRLGLRGSILVNDRMETSLPDIYAVGDAVQVRHLISGREALIPLAGPANKQGRIAADNICGGDSRYPGSMGTSILKVFELTAARCGLSEAEAQAANIAVDKLLLSPMSHAGYYPGGKLMTLKILFEPASFRLLGAQIIGYEGVDKRLDVLAACIKAGLPAPELKELELAYAPPYSSAKDPVNMAGFMADNLARGLVRQAHLAEVLALPKDGSVSLVDARTPAEYAKDHLEGFVNIPLDKLRQRLAELPPDKPVYVICQSGLRSYIACRLLTGHGYEAYNVAGGFRYCDAVLNDRRLAESALPCGMDEQ